MSGQALYRTLHAQLRQRIRDGHHAPGEALPGEMELARLYGCSRVTVRKALAQLAEEGLVARQQGRGTIVLEGRAADPVRAEVSGLVDSFVALGKRTRVDVLHFSFEPPPARIREALGLEAGRQALHTVRLRHYRDAPFSYSVAWVPEEIGQAFSRADLAAQSLTHLMRRSGVNACRAHQRVFAAAADTVVAPLLGLERGSPVLGIERRMEDADGRVVEHLRVFYHPERYEFEISMESDPRGDAGVWMPQPASHPNPA